MAEFILIASIIIASIGFFVDKPDVVGVAVMAAVVVWFLIFAEDVDNHSEDKLEMVEEICGQ